MAKKIRKKHVSVYCQYCQCSHGEEELDVEVDGKEVNVYCQESGLQLWLQKEDKQKLVYIYNN